MTIIVRKHKRRTKKGRTTVKKHSRKVRKRRIIIRYKPELTGKFDRDLLEYYSKSEWGLPQDVIKEMDSPALINFLRNKEIKSRIEGTQEYKELSQDQKVEDKRVEEEIRMSEMREEAELKRVRSYVRGCI